MLGLDILMSRPLPAGADERVVRVLMKLGIILFHNVLIFDYTVVSVWIVVIRIRVKISYA